MNTTTWRAVNFVALILITTSSALAQDGPFGLRMGESYEQIKMAGDKDICGMLSFALVLAAGEDASVLDFAKNWQSAVNTYSIKSGNEKLATTRTFTTGDIDGFRYRFCAWEFDGKLAAVFVPYADVAPLETTILNSIGARLGNPASDTFRQTLSDKWQRVWRTKSLVVAYIKPSPIIEWSKLRQAERDSGLLYLHRPTVKRFTERYSAFRKEVEREQDKKAEEYSRSLGGTRKSF